MNTRMVANEISRTASPVQDGLPEEAISKVHNGTPNERLLMCAAAFLRRMGN